MSCARGPGCAGWDDAGDGRVIAEEFDEATPVRLSREVIIDTFLKIVQEEDGESPTLRRLGEELGADPTALYRYFRAKDDLVAAVADRVLGEVVDGFEPTGEWRRDIREVARRLRLAYLRHSRVLLPLAASPHTLENGPVLAEHLMRALRSIDLPPEEAALAFEAIEDYVIGAGSLDALSNGAAQRWQPLWASASPDEFPNVVATAHLMYRDVDAAFDYGLELMLDALAARTAQDSEGQDRPAVR